MPTTNEVKLKRILKTWLKRIVFIFLLGGKNRTALSFKSDKVRVYIINFSAWQHQSTKDA